MVGYETYNPLPGSIIPGSPLANMFKSLLTTLMQNKPNPMGMFPGDAPQKPSFPGVPMARPPVLPYSLNPAWAGTGSMTPTIPGQGINRMPADAMSRLRSRFQPLGGPAVAPPPTSINPAFSGPVPPMTRLMTRLGR